MVLRVGYPNGHEECDLQLQSPLGPSPHRTHGDRPMLVSKALPGDPWGCGGEAKIATVKS